MTGKRGKDLGGGHVPDGDDAVAAASGQFDAVAAQGHAMEISVARALELARLRADHGGSLFGQGRLPQDELVRGHRDDLEEEGVVKVPFLFPG
jgi:hypothetical protein